MKALKNDMVTFKFWCYSSRQLIFQRVVWQLIVNLLKNGGAVDGKSFQNWWDSCPTLPTGSANPECRHKKACEMHFVVIRGMKVLKSKSSYDFSYF